MRQFFSATIAILLVCAPFLLHGTAAAAAEHASWDSYMKANRYKCPGPFDILKKNKTLTLGGKKYTHSGHRLEIKSYDADKKIKIGVVGAIKDASEGTRKNFAEAIKWFKAEGVEWIIANGDLALEEFDLEDVADMLGETGMPTIVILGNAESRGSWARTFKDRAEKYPNLVNGVWVRQIIADDVEFWTLPGYHNKAFVHQGAGCLYKPEDVKDTRKKLTPKGDAPVVLIAHGPPKGKGKHALDYISDKKNVGDPSINKMMKKANISFGLFGHILEAGGRGTGKDFSSPVKAGKSAKALHINAGSISGDPWGLNNGKTSFGMAMIFSMDNGKASYVVKNYKSSF